MEKKIIAGLIQQANSSNREENMSRLKSRIEECARQGAQLVVLQELHNGLYFCQTENPDCFDEAEPIPGPSTQFYGDIARDCHIVLVTSLFERRAPGLYHNTAVVFDKDGLNRRQIPQNAHSRTTRPITRNSTSLPATSALNPYRPR